MAKSSVSSLQEYCAQNRLSQPLYEYIEGEDGGFVCKVEVLDMYAYGNGRSKRDAKHLGALNLMKKIRVEDIADAAELPLNTTSGPVANINRDMLKELRDYCVKKDMPLPIIDIVQQSGTPDAPEFVALCSLASIKRYATSDKKKDARQKAAIEMLRVVCTEQDGLAEIADHLQLFTSKETTVCETLEDLEAERRQKFKTYRDLTETGNSEMYGVKLCDRHNYFKNYFPHLKQAALAIIRSQEYECEKSQATELLHALKLKWNTSILESDSVEPLLFIELVCEYDCVFLNLESQIYAQIVRYFGEMLI